MPVNLCKKNRRATLERVYKRFGLDSKLVYADLDSRATPMTLSLPSAAIDVVTDVDRVNLLKKESQELVTLLEDLFVTPTAAVQTTEEINPRSMAAITANLADSVVTLLKLLISRDAWEREKLLDIAADMEVKLEDALVEINRKVLAAFDTPLITGDATITIDRDISAALLL